MALLDRSLRDFLDDVAARGRTPAGGSAAALVTALAAALLAKIARTSTAWPESRGIAAQAESLRDRAAPLAQADAEEYEAALQAREDDGGEAGERRDFALGRAYARAAEPPLQIARAAADVAELAVVVARNGDPAFHADAVTAALLAAAAASSAAELVGVNLTASVRDERVREAERLAENAARAAEEARAARE
ncbi:MAG: cyclodeaminase/cyclohydrolase family protein [Gaiellaceae bacterium]